MQKALALVNVELELLDKQMMYPKFFITENNTSISDLHLDTNVISYVDIMEVIAGLFYLAGIKTSDGKTVSLNRLTNRFEHFLNFRISDIYKKEEEVLQRLPTKRTGFLDKLKGLIHKKSCDKGYKP
ncbi:RteC domain-containing protein [Bacteroides nordii]